jgi:ornithine cyclodeaminase/alanine dehydrogenase-like protein (mu-crystallin family)
MDKGALRMSLRILSAADVSATLSTLDCIRAVEGAFRAWATGLAAPPAMLGVHVEEGGFHIKAATLAIGGRRYFAAKTNGNFPGNPDRRGLPCIQGVVVLCDADSGTPVALLDSIRLTVLRTAAATAVAAKHLARPDATVLTLIGCGAQAESHLVALAAVRGLQRILLVDRDRRRAERLAAASEKRLGISVEVRGDLEEAVRTSDICVTCTTATRPFVTADMALPGSFVAGVGADHPHKSELHPELLASAKVVVDSLEQCASSGDLHHAIEAGTMRASDVHAELGQVVAGLRPGRQGDHETIVFDSTGTALQDVATAALVYERSVGDGRGMEVEIANEASVGV